MCCQGAHFLEHRVQRADAGLGVLPARVPFHIGSLSVSHTAAFTFVERGATFFNTLHVGDEVQILSH